MRIALSAFALVTAVSFAGLTIPESASAQARVRERGNIAVTGDITAIDTEARTITVKSPNDEGIVYRVDASATIMAGGRNIPFEELQTGWNAAVNGHQNGDDRLLTLIKVVTAPPTD